LTWGTYVHVPWCRRRCPYCAFYVEADRDVDWAGFVHRVLREHHDRRRAFEGTASTVFLGGGTPSRMPTDALHTLLDGLAPAPDAEVTAECNPEDCTPAWLDGAITAGVNRVSLGLQTFQPRFARLLNRACSVDDARDTARRLAAAPLNSWSLDLIFALPGQTLADVDADLDAIAEVAPPHVALYGLTYEPGTPFDRARERGKLTALPDDTWRTMYDHIVARLRAMGIDRYEVSNFARPGHRSAHNQGYWSDQPYLGVGPSAHGYLPDGTRYHNVRDVVRYLADDDCTATVERPTPTEAATDHLVSVLRGVGGVNLDRLARRTGLCPPSGVVQRLCIEGLLTQHGAQIALTDAGFPVADAVIAHLADRLAPAVPAPSAGL